MDLVIFLEHNWFLIGVFISIIGTVWKTGTKFTDYKNELNKRDKNLNEKIDNLKKDIKADNDKLRKDFSDRFNDLDNRINKQEKARESGVERTLIIMNGVEATLKTLHDKGANGPVTESLAELEEYKSRKAAEN